MGVGNSKKVGQIGEETACKFLEKRGFEIIERNYWKKWGEIDIIAKKKEGLHFIEVKSVSYNNNSEKLSDKDRHRPEDNIHSWKLKRLGKAIQTYLAEKDLEEESWSFDVVTVFLDFEEGTAEIRLVENVII